VDCSGETTFYHVSEDCGFDKAAVGDGQGVCVRKDALWMWPTAMMVKG
jgi:hypothetical protein